MASIFTKIIRREIPSYVVAESNQFIAFLDAHPLAMGHTLVVLKQEVDYIFNCDDTTLSSMIVFAKKVARSIQKCVPCKRIGVAVIGFEVPHTHVHLVPMNKMDDINFSNPKLTPSKKDFAKMAGKIREAFRG